MLPFENLSANPENAFFADGVQDEVLTYLAKIADLKVKLNQANTNREYQAFRDQIAADFLPRVDHLAKRARVSVHQIVG